jgi:hypothetical protein
MRTLQRCDRQPKRRGIDVPWDGPPRVRRAKACTPGTPQLALRFAPECDPERPLAGLPGMRMHLRPTSSANESGTFPSTVLTPRCNRDDGVRL